MAKDIQAQLPPKRYNYAPVAGKTTSGSRAPFDKAKGVEERKQALFDFLCKQESGTCGQAGKTHLVLLSFINSFPGLTPAPERPEEYCESLERLLRAVTPNGNRRDQHSARDGLIRNVLELGATAEEMSAIEREMRLFPEYRRCSHDEIYPRLFCPLFEKVLNPLFFNYENSKDRIEALRGIMKGFTRVHQALGRTEEGRQELRTGAYFDYFDCLWPSIVGNNRVLLNAYLKGIDLPPATPKQE